MNFKGISNLEELLRKAERTKEDVEEYFEENFVVDVEFTSCEGKYSKGYPQSREDPGEPPMIEFDIYGFFESKLLKDDLDILIDYYTPLAEKHIIELVENGLSNSKPKYKHREDLQQDEISEILFNSDDIEKKQVAALIFLIREMTFRKSSIIKESLISSVIAKCKVSSSKNLRNKFGGKEEEDYDDDKFDYSDINYDNDHDINYDDDFSVFLRTEAEMYAEDSINHIITLTTLELIDEFTYKV